MVRVPGLPNEKQVHMVGIPGTRTPDAQPDRQTYKHKQVMTAS